jgi:DNA polymerase
MESEFVNYFSYLRDLGEEELYIDSELIGVSRRDEYQSARRRLDRLKTEAEECRHCSLWENRTNLVFGVGNPCADLMFIGEAPGRDEDLRGEPFVGAAGQLLDKILKAMDLQRDEVYIANLLKCRPPMNRDPLYEEIEACWSFLEQQVEIIAPKVICTLGSFAARTLLGSNAPLGRLRGRIHVFRGIEVVPTYHPAALLRHPAWKRPTWEDMKVIMKIIGKSPCQ